MLVFASQGVRSPLSFLVKAEMLCAFVCSVHLLDRPCAPFSHTAFMSYAKNRETNQQL
jgi:hypothetical protein